MFNMFKMLKNIQILLEIINYSITNSPCTSDSVTVDYDINKNIYNKIIDSIACTQNKKDLIF